MRLDVRDNQQGSASLDKFYEQVRKTYLANLRRKDQVHFGTAEGVKVPIESIFMQITFKPLVFVLLER